MKFKADHAFHIGSQHLRGGLPCQDYAISDTRPDSVLGILADGCSSGGRTDVGARIIAHTTARVLKRDVAILNDNVVDIACHHLDVAAMQSLGLTPSDMLATCSYVAVYPDMSDGIARIVGDGVLASIDLTGDLIMMRRDWAHNMPAYRIYRQDDYAGFIAAHGDENAFTVVDTTHARIGGTVHTATSEATLKNAIGGVRHSIELQRKRVIAVFSDGVTQVDGMDWRDVVAELMSFKSTEGEFVKRRMNRFLKDCLTCGKGPIDDISMAAIHIDHEVD